MATITLPTLPTDAEFEDYVSACLQASGYFVDTSLIHREDEEVLELDAIATRYTKDVAPQEKLVEVKSGDWGFPEIFKIRGWGSYLKIEDLSLVVCKAKPQQEFVRKKSKEIGVLLTHHPNNAADIEKSELFTGKMFDPIDVIVLRFSYWAERQVRKRIKTLKKSNPTLQGYQVLDRYYYEVTSAAFFSNSLVERARALYSSFQANSNLSARLMQEKSGKPFDDDPEEIPKNHFADAFYACKLTDLTLSTYAEQRGRLALLKTGVDICKFEDHGLLKRVGQDLEFLGMKFPLKSLLPGSFLTGIEEIRNQEYYYLYPVFWQTFLWLFGGFILDDYKDAEYKLLSMKTGIPTSHIDQALAAYDKIFPTPGGWLRAGDGYSRISFIKMVPPPMMGVGAHYRRLQYGASQDVNDLKSLTGTYTVSDLAKRINCLVELLQMK